MLMFHSIIVKLWVAKDVFSALYTKMPKNVFCIKHKLNKHLLNWILGHLATGIFQSDADYFGWSNHPQSYSTAMPRWQKLLLYLTYFYIHYSYLLVKITRKIMSVVTMHYNFTDYFLLLKHIYWASLITIHNGRYRDYWCVVQAS